MDKIAEANSEIAANDVFPDEFVHVWNWCPYNRRDQYSFSPYSKAKSFLFTLFIFATT